MDADGIWRRGSSTLTAVWTMITFVFCVPVLVLSAVVLFSTAWDTAWIQCIGINVFIEGPCLVSGRSPEVVAEFFQMVAPQKVSTAAMFVSASMRVLIDTCNSPTTGSKSSADCSRLVTFDSFGQLVNDICFMGFSKCNEWKQFAAALGNSQPFFLAGFAFLVFSMALMILDIFFAFMFCVRRLGTTEELGAFKRFVETAQLRLFSSLSAAVLLAIGLIVYSANDNHGNLGSRFRSNDDDSDSSSSLYGFTLGPAFGMVIAACVLAFICALLDGLFLWIGKQRLLTHSKLPIPRVRRQVGWIKFNQDPDYLFRRFGIRQRYMSLFDSQSPSATSDSSAAGSLPRSPDDPVDSGGIYAQM
eukprot:ANDGO_05870.mRNA.1 hypothetical protein